jgi:helicase
VREVVVPDLFRAARERGVTAPDWSAGRPPRGCQLNEARYLSLLRDRATETRIAEENGTISITAPPNATVVVWSGQAYTVAEAGERDRLRFADLIGDRPVQGDRPAPAEEMNRGACVFTRRGDALATGWLAAYNKIIKR